LRAQFYELYKKEFFIEKFKSKPQLVKFPSLNQGKGYYFSRLRKKGGKYDFARP
jgi:hypothetical protein